MPPRPWCRHAYSGVRANERKMMVKTLTLLAAAATIGIGLSDVPSNASARVLHHPHTRAYIAPAYRPPAGQGDDGNPDRAQYEQPWSCGGGSC
jgi:hypothetical protein